MASAQNYSALITSEHADKPRFVATVEALCQAFSDINNMLAAMPDDFDLDQAVGPQLDAIGLWVGISRGITVPLTGIYFTWDSGDTTISWDKGYWQGPFDPSTGLVQVDDTTYRTLLRAKIAANNWDGTNASLVSILNATFGSGVVIPQDNQDMSLTLIYDDLVLDTVTKQLLITNGFPFKPGGVHVNYVAASASPIFAWDSNLPKFQGWDDASWAAGL
jgi:hypothetical protein